MVFSTVPTVLSIHIFVGHEFFSLENLTVTSLLFFYLTIFRLQATPKISELIYTDILTDIKKALRQKK